MRVSLRMDDIGASTKKYEVYSNFPFGNFLFIKYLKPFRAWGPYREMGQGDWERVLRILQNHNAKLTVAVTAAWVDKNGDYIPFPEIFPDESACLKRGHKEGYLEIANHGLTHCVVGKHMPRLFSSNRKYHREFWDWIPRDVHVDHIVNSQKILQEWLGAPVTTLVPPGNVYSLDTIKAAGNNGIERINSHLDLGMESPVKIVGDEAVIAFHDREIVLEGPGWLERRLAALPQDTEYVFVRDL